MAFIRRTRLLALLLCVLTAAFAMGGCARSPVLQAKSSSPKETPQTGGNPGGEDSGGGETFKSSPELVKATIQKAYEMIVFAQNRATYDSSGELVELYDPFQIRKILFDSAQDETDRKLLERLLNLLGPEETAEAAKMNIELPEHLALGVLLVQSQVQFSMNNSCQSVDKKHPDAAVAHHKVGAPICFNIGLIARISPAALPAEVFALFLHELAHLKGLKEEEATAIQRIAAGAVANEIALAEEFLVGLHVELVELSDLLTERLKAGASVSTDREITEGYLALGRRIRRFDRVQAIAGIVNPLGEREALEKCGKSLRRIGNPFANPELQPSSVADRFTQPRSTKPISKIIDYRHSTITTIRLCDEFAKGWRHIRAGRNKPSRSGEHK